MFGFVRAVLSRHLHRVLKQTFNQGTLSDTPWEFAVWLHQEQKGVPIFSRGFPFFFTTWNVYTAWQEYRGTSVQHWLSSPVDAVEAARRFRSEGWKKVFICSTRFGLTGRSHKADGKLDDPIEFSELALKLEREQNEKLSESLGSSAFASAIHLIIGVPAAITRGLFVMARFLFVRETPSWYEFWAIVAWRLSEPPQRIKQVGRSNSASTTCQPQQDRSANDTLLTDDSPQQSK